MVLLNLFLLFGTLGLPEIILIIFVIILLFGITKLPQLGGAIGKSIKNLKKELKEGETFKCPKCNEEIINNDAQFCPKCGEKIK